MFVAPEMLPLALSKAIQVRSTRLNTYEGSVSADFCYASALALPTAHGGYIGSIILQALKHHFQDSHPTLNQPDAFNVHYRFLEATNAGPITITLTDTKLGKNTSTIHFTATQNHTTKIVGYAMHFNASARLNKGISHATPPLLTPAPLLVSFPALATNTDANWIVHIAPYHPSHTVKSQTQCRYALPRRGMPSAHISDGWLAPVQPGERWTDVSLAWLVDQWPQGVPGYRPDPHLEAEDQKGDAADRADYGLLNTPRGLWKADVWFPTITMDFEVKRGLPEEGLEWVFVRSMARTIRDGRMGLEVWIFDTQGEVVCVSHHVCFVIELKGKKDNKRKGKDEKL